MGGDAFEQTVCWRVCCVAAYRGEFRSEGSTYIEKNDIVIIKSFFYGG